MRKGLILLVMFGALAMTALSKTTVRLFCPQCQKVYTDCVNRTGNEQYCELLALDCQDNLCPR